MKCEIALLLIIWNIVVFFVYGIDKRKAKRSAWRISERVLIIMAFLMGACGALFGMGIFHHKTRHTKFKIGVPVALICNIGVLIGILWRMGQ